MAKLTLSPITSRYASVAALNANFDAIETALENTLSRDGTSPNVMEVDLDMNGNRILNALAQSGDGFIWQGAWVTATSYALNNLVSTTGNTYICTTAHTSGVFATDLAAGKWELLASKGAAGAGSGDMIGANNLSDLTDANAARTNLGVAIGADVQAYSASIPTTLASQAEAEAGSNNTKWMTPLRVSQAITALATAGGTSTRTTFTASGSITIPANVTQVLVTGQAAGGGGGGLTGAGAAGGNLTFGPNGGAVVLTLTGGSGGGTISSGTGGTGGAGGGSGINQGERGKNGQYSQSVGGGVNPANYAIRRGGAGGSGMFGNLGSGGDGADSSTSAGGVTSDGAAGGGGAGEQCFSFPITVTAGQWDVTIGAAGAIGTGTGGGNAASAGKGGFFIVEYWS